LNSRHVIGIRHRAGPGKNLGDGDRRSIERCVVGSAARTERQTGSGADSAGKQAELYKAAMEKALTNMTELAEAVKKANEEAFAIVSARVQESIAELQALAPKG
jgi:phasin family protein